MNVFNKVLVIILLLSLLMSSWRCFRCRPCKPCSKAPQMQPGSLQTNMWLFSGTDRSAVLCCGVHSLIWQEVRIGDRSCVSTEGGCEAAVTADSVARRLTWHPINSRTPSHSRRSYGGAKQSM